MFDLAALPGPAFMPRIKLSIVLIAMALGGSVQALASSAPFPSAIARQIEVDMLRYKIPGAAAAIVQSGKPVSLRGFGLADIERARVVQPDKTQFRIASSTKIITWLAIMQLVESGQIDLDQDVNTYLVRAKVPAVKGWRAVTIRDLMSHTAGFGEVGFGLIWSPSERQTLPIHALVANHMPKRMFAPGKVSAYSNFGVMLAGLVIEDTTGQSYSRYVESRIFAPLGMNNSTYDEPLSPHNEAVGYEWARDAYQRVGFEYVGTFSAAGSMSSTASDMAKLIPALLGERPAVLRPASARLMQQSLFRLHPKLPGMAHGWFEEYDRGHKVLSHGGDIEAFHAELAIVPELGAGYFFAYSSFGGVMARPATIASFNDYLIGSAGPQKSPQTDPPYDLPSTAQQGSAAQVESGAFRRAQHHYRHIAEIGGLLLSEVWLEAQDDTLSISGTAGEAQFRAISRDLYRSADGQMIGLARSEQGDVDRMGFADDPSGTYYRISVFDTRSFNIAALIGALALAFGRLLITGPKPQAVSSRVVRWSSGVGLFCAVGFGAGIAAIVVSEGFKGLYSHVPPALPWLLILPLIVVACAVAATGAAFGGLLRRKSIRLFDAIDLAACAGLIAMCLLAYRWNFVGWHY